jgi:hypothetical protein
LMAEARDVDVFLVALVDQVVDRELRADDAWGADEPARRRLLDLLARHCVARVRGAITTRLLAAGAHTDPRCTRIGRVRLPRRPRFGYDRGESRRRRPRRP